MTINQAVKAFKFAQRADRWAGQVVGAPSDLRWSDSTAGLYAIGLGIRVVGAGLVVVLAYLLLSIVAFAPSLQLLGGHSFGVMLLFASHVIYPTWTQAVSFHASFLGLMALLLLVLVSGAAVGLTPYDLGDAIAASFGFGFGFLLAFGIIEQITAVILSAFEPVANVWGSRSWARHNARLIRRAQRRAARRAKRA